jgi:hypothetical protein
VRVQLETTALGLSARWIQRCIRRKADLNSAGKLQISSRVVQAVASRDLFGAAHVFLLLVATVSWHGNVNANMEASRISRTPEMFEVHRRCPPMLKVRRGMVFFIYFSQIYNLLMRSDHPMMILLYIYIYCALCCVCLYSSSSLWSFNSEGRCHFSLLLTFNGLLNSVT